MSVSQKSGPAVALLSVGIVAFAIQDLVMKLASGTYPLHQALAIRAAAALPVALIIVYMAGSISSLKGSTRAMWPRSLLLVVTNITYYVALAALPMATVSALYLTAPLLITVLSVLFLSEKVGLVQWAAILAGMAGVILIVHPGDGAFEWAMLLPLVSALAYAGSVIFVRKTKGDNDAAVMAFQGTLWLSLAGLAMGAMLGFGEMKAEIRWHPSADFLLSGWHWPTARDTGIMLLGGVVGSAATLFLTRAYANSSASVLAPFEYTALLWSILLGCLFWGHLPTSREWLGIAVLICAGLASVLFCEAQETEPA